MKKKKLQKKKTSRFKVNSADSKLNKQPFPIRLLKNLLLLVGAFLLMHSMKNYNNGYRWTFENLIQNNFKLMKRYKKLNHEQRLEAKLGFTGKYLSFINKNTARDAIIIMPPDSVLLPSGQKSDFNKFITRKGWASYFVYPRKLIYEDAKDVFPQIYQKATHVAIVNYWGYHKLTYKVNGKNKHTVMLLNLNRQKK